MPIRQASPTDTAQSIAATSLPKHATAIKFTAAWCGPCKQHPFTAVAENPELRNVALVSCDIDTCPKLAEFFGVRSVPLVVVIDSQGIPKATIPGVPQPAKLVEKLLEAYTRCL